MVVASVAPGRKAVHASVVVVPELSEVGTLDGADRHTAAVLLPATLSTTPEVHSTVADAIETSVARYRELLQEAAAEGTPTGPGRLHALERSLHARVAKECVDPVVGACIKAAHDDPAVLSRAEAIVDATPHLRPQRASEHVKIHLLGGSTVSVKTPYFLRRPPRGRGHPRGRGRRMPEGNGLYPVLASLGIHFRASPALASDIARLVAMSTEAEAQQSLALRGIEMGQKTITRLTRRLAKRGLTHRAWRIEQTASGQRGTDVVRGKRIVIGTDGGRVRLRVAKTKGRRRPSGHRGFRAPWKEPKVLVIYEIDEKGKKRRHGLVRYDATMEDADGIFDILVAILREIGAHEAAEWIVTGDGASWIWNRVPRLIEDVGYDREKVTEVVDFYHAAQRLWEVAEERKGWTDTERRKWVGKMKRHLRRGLVEKVLSEARELCRGCKSREIKGLLGYFSDHQHRMRYDLFRKRGLPLGSGAVESCVRRTINLRVKGNGIFWRRERVEEMLHLRAQLLSGRWNEYVEAILEPEAFWKAA